MLPSESTAADKAGHAGIRAYGTVAVYVQNIKKEGGVFFICIQLPDAISNTIDPQQKL